MDPFAEILEQYNIAVLSWKPIALGIARNLFVLLATIQISWSAIEWMLKKDDPVDLFIDFVRKLITIGFFFMIINNYDVFVKPISEGFLQAGDLMIGTKVRLSPSNIFARGATLSSYILTTSKHGGVLLDFAGALFSTVVAIVVLLCFILIAIKVALITIGGKIILTAGIIMLGFSGSKWTIDFTRKYLTAAVTIGIQLLFITLIVGLGESLSQQWKEIIANAPPDKWIEAYISVLGAALLFMMIAWLLPDMGAQMLTGVFSMNFSQMPVIAGGAVAGVATAKAVGSAGLQASGATSAVRAATQVASGVIGSAATYNPGQRTAGAALKTALKSVADAGAGHLKEVTAQTRQKLNSAIAKTHGGRIAERIRNNSANTKSLPKPPPKKL